MHITNLISKAKNIELLQQELSNIEPQSNNTMDKDILVMEIDLLTQELRCDIENFIADKHHFDKNSRYLMNLERQNIYSVQPKISDLVEALEDYTYNMQQYSEEKDWKSRDIVKRLENNFLKAKNRLIHIFSAFIGNSNRQIAC